MMGELFAGIGGFRLGFERAGWQCLWANDNDKAACRIYRKHWPDGILRETDIQALNPAELPDVDCITGGWPCQDLSTAGQRRGLAGERSGLFWELMRIVRQKRPRFLVLENVPGLLSSQRGRDFGLVLNALGELGYGVAWRVLDSQWFGVPQRRRRVFIVGHRGAIAPAEVLFESPCGSGPTAPVREAGNCIAQCLEGVAPSDRRRGDSSDNLITATLRGHNRNNSDPTTEAKALITGLAARQRQSCGAQGQAREMGGCHSGSDGFGSPTNPNGVREVAGVPGRVDMPLCRCPDSPRYRALGNAVTVPVIEWIARRLAGEMQKCLSD